MYLARVKHSQHCRVLRRGPAKEDVGQRVQISQILKIRYLTRVATDMLIRCGNSYATFVCVSSSCCLLLI